MSFTVTNGLLFAGDILQVHEFIMSKREAIYEKQQSFEMRFVANYAVRTIDIAVLNGKTVDYPLDAAVEEIQKQKTSSDLFREPDTSVEISVLPYKGRVYGIAHVSRRELFEIISDDPFVREYSFWDNSDRPETVTLSEWRKRGRVWDEILKKGSYRPSQCGFTAKIKAPDTLFVAERIINFVPSLEQRALMRARELILTKKIDWSSKANDIFEGLQWLDTDEGKEELAKEVDTVKRRLPEITIGLLNRGNV